MQALGYVPRDQIEPDWVVLVPADGNGPGLSLSHSRTPFQAHPRVHLDLYAGDAAHRPARSNGWSLSAPSVSAGTSTRRTPTSWFWPTPAATASASSTLARLKAG